MITIAQPLYGPVPNPAHIAYSALVSRASRKYEISFEYVSNAYIDRARNIMARSAIDSGSSHVLFIDHDMLIPPDALDRLLAHNLDVVGALYFCKQPPFTPVYVELGGRDGFTMQETFKPGLNKVGASGAGCLLVRVDALEKVNAHFQDDQWFRINMPMGEDVWFGKRCSEVGIDSYVDSDIQCGHVGDYVTTIDDHQAYRKFVDEQSSNS